MQSPRNTLTAGAGELGLALDSVQVDQLLGLLDLLSTWNAKFNLTAIKEPIAMVEKHLLDSLSVQPWIRGPRVTDVGTGAGFPGLPLAIVNPALRFTLLDATGKKIRFVAHAARALGLDHVEAICARAENFRPAEGSATVVSRALAALPAFVAAAGHLCAPGGALLAMKGRDPGAELADLPRGWRVRAIERLRVPGLDAERHLVILEREPQP